MAATDPTTPTSTPTPSAAQLYQRIQSMAETTEEIGQANPAQPGVQYPDDLQTAQQPPNDPQPQVAQQTQEPPQQSTPPQPAQPAQFAQPTEPQESALLPGMYRPQPEELLLEWVAPQRPFKKPNKRFFTTIITIVVLISLILFFANQVLPVAVVCAAGFLAYVLYSIPPGDVRHQLTTYGIRIDSALYYWEELGRFWFTTELGFVVLHIEIARFPNRIHLLLGDIQEEDMKAILSEVLLYERPPLTTVEKMGNWLREKVPLDLES